MLPVSCKYFPLCLQNTINTRNVCVSSQGTNFSHLTKIFSHNQDFLENDHMLSKCVQSATFYSLKIFMPWFFFTLRFLNTIPKAYQVGKYEYVPALFTQEGLGNILPVLFPLNSLEPNSININRSMYCNTTIQEVWLRNIQRKKYLIFKKLYWTQ